MVDDRRALAPPDDHHEVVKEHYWGWFPKKRNGLKHVRCNPDVAPRLTSGGYEDKVHVNAPINILFTGGGKF